MRKSIVIFLLLALAVSLLGCGITGKIKPSSNPIKVLHSNWNDQVAETFRNGTYKTAYDGYVKDGDEENANFERRRQVNLIIAGIDSYYDRKIKGGLIAGKAAWDTGNEIITLMLTGAASVAGGDTPKILAAIATAIQGTKISVDKNFFQDNSATMIVIKMDQLRAEVYADVQLALVQSYRKYPLEEAMRDVIRYYSAGTMKGALIAIVKDAGAKQQKADQETKELVKTKAQMEIKKKQIELEREKKALNE